MEGTEIGLRKYWEKQKRVLISGKLMVQENVAPTPRTAALLALGVRSLLLTLFTYVFACLKFASRLPTRTDSQGSCLILCLSAWNNATPIRGDPSLSKRQD